VSTYLVGTTERFRVVRVGDLRGGNDMRVKAFTFDGYPPGNHDFAGRYAALELNERDEFDEMLHVVVRAVFADILSQPYVAITVIGHSDRQDLPGMTHQQAQASEAEASRARAVDAWTWLSDRISVLVGEDYVGWEENSPKVTWAWVSAGSGQLVHPNPSNDQQRLENRRVVVLFSHFEINA
jgi:hypothetical protein